MKKILTAVAMALLLLGCVKQEDDHSAILEKLAELDNRVSALEGSIASIQSAIGDGVFAQKVEPYVDTETGKTIGVTVTYTSGKVVYFEISPKAGYAGPVLGVITNGAGQLVWAVDGVAIKDNKGNEVPVNKTPVFTIDEDGYLLVSIDGGDPVVVGKVQNEGATLVDGIFKDIRVEQDKVVLVLSDDSIVNIPFATAFKLNIEQKEYILENNNTITIPYTVSGKTENTVVGVAGYDPYYFYVEVAEENIKITPLHSDSEAVFLIYADSQVGLTSMVSVCVSRESAYVLDPEPEDDEYDYMVEGDGGTLEMHVVSNVEIEAKVPEEDSWISIVSTKSTKYTITAQIEENTGAAREGRVYIYKKGTDKKLQTIWLYQAKGAEKPATDLSKLQSANSYIISEAGKFKFKTVKGNSNESVGTVASAALLWETYNNDQDVTANSVIAEVSYADNYITFSTPSTLKPGNALIAAKDAEGKVLWSWHIWVPKTIPTADFYGLSTSIKMMDRNLGALDVLSKDSPKAEDAGFFYQWGRKDPLRAISSIADGTVAKTNPAEAWAFSETQLTAANMHETPCVFIKGSEDWIDVSDKTLWGETKTVNDPCPVGYMVPKREATALFDYLTVDETVYKGWSYDDTKYFFAIGAEATSYTVFPYGHFTRGGKYDLKGDGKAWFWTATNKGDSEMTQARTMVLSHKEGEEKKINCSGQKKANGAYVRCIVDPNAPVEDKTINLSENGTANSYIVDKAGDFKFKAVKGNGTESVGTVASAAIVWETDNTTTAVADNAIIAKVGVEEGYITFSTPATLKPGNALIAAKDAEGKILWSWHIWIPQTTIAVNSYAGMFGADAMDRNLGALTAAVGSDTDKEVATCAGLLYQWGRKDPISGAGDFDAKAEIKLSKAREDASDAQITIAESIAHPTKFAYNGPTASKEGGYKGLNWSSEDNDTAWGSATAKGLYDPCPPGYRVPYYDAELAAWKADNWVLKTTNYWYKLGDAIFPYAGYLDDCNGGLSHGYDRSAVWSAKGSGDTANSFDVRDKYSAATQNKARGNSVRCVTEETLK